MSQQQVKVATVSGQQTYLEPALERQIELREAYEANMAAGSAPYAGVDLRSRSEIVWIMKERGWTGTPTTPHHGRVDLRHAILSDIDLSGMYLRYLDLSEAFLQGVNLDEAFLERSTLHGTILIRHTTLSGAILEDAVLTRAYFHKTDLSNTDLAGAKLNGARLIRANFRSAILSHTDLHGAYLIGVDLQGANLSGARMDSRTVLHRAIFDSNTRLRDVVWGGASLANIEWSKVRQIGEETIAHKMLSKRKRVVAYRTAARTYHDLVRTLQSQGLSSPASKFRLREQDMERKALYWNRELGAWLFSLLLNVVAGYGERPSRTLRLYAVVVATFAASFYMVTHRLLPVVTSNTDPLSPIDAFVLSITSFHGRGIFQSTHILSDPIGFISAIEAVIGLFIEAIFVATFSRRFLSD